MKTILKRIARKAGRLVEARVRPMLAAEIDERVRPALDDTAAVVRENIARTDDVLQYLRRSAEETTLLLDSLVRELVRAQMRIESLEQVVQDHHERSEALRAGTTSEERLMVG